MIDIERVVVQGTLRRHDVDRYYLTRSDGHEWRLNCFPERVGCHIGSNRIRVIGYYSGLDTIDVEQIEDIAEAQPRPIDLNVLLGLTR